MSQKEKIDLYACPERLGELATNTWNTLVPVLKEKGKLEVIYLGVLEQCCVLTGEMQSAGEQFSAAKHTQLRLIQAELGLTPASSGKLHTKKESYSMEPWVPKEKD